MNVATNTTPGARTQVRVKLFAVARQLTQRDSIELDLPPNPTVADLRAALAERVPALRAHLPSMLFAVDANYANDRTPLDSTTDIACIPPVSGG